MSLSIQTGSSYYTDCIFFIMSHKMHFYEQYQVYVHFQMYVWFMFIKIHV